MRVTLLTILATAAVLRSVAAEEPIRIFAAASLTDALAEVVSEFEAAHPPARVVYQFGGSSDLARQILAGAPADLFLSADERQMKRVVDNGRAQTSLDLLSNQLVIVRHRDDSNEFRGPEELDRFDRIAMAHPEAVPAGVYAKEYLESRALWSRLKGRVVPTLDVRAALAAVASGNIGAGFVYRTDAAIEDRVRIAYSVPLEDGPRIVYVLAILANRERKDTRAFFEYLQSDAATAIFERFGFLSPP